jgi:hypothetical protein
MENSGRVLHLLGQNHQRRVRQLHELRLLERQAATRGMTARSVLREVTTTAGVVPVERWMGLNSPKSEQLYVSHVKLDAR